MWSSSTCNVAPDTLRFVEDEGVEIFVVFEAQAWKSSFQDVNVTMKCARSRANLADDVGELEQMSKTFSILLFPSKGVVVSIYLADDIQGCHAFVDWQKLEETFVLRNLIVMIG